MTAVGYTQGYRPFQYADFSGGLNLRDKSDAVGDKEAIDLLNVTFNDRGAIHQRDGFSDFTPADLTNRVDSLSPYYSASGQRQLIAGCGTRIEAIDVNGNAINVLSGLAGGPWQFARFGDPTHEYLYCANGQDNLVRWDGGSFASGAAPATVNGVAGQQMPRAGAVCVTASTPGSTSGTNASNRLIATAFGAQTNAGPGGAATTPSRVYESNAGQPEVWETDGDPGDPATQRPARGRNYYDLTPGDGERILTAVSWRELTFIFKETKFFVRWGEGTGADGTPTFQTREVVNNVGLSAPLAVSVGRDGVYFLNRMGVYRTTGGDPVLLSDVLRPLWTGDPELYYQGSPINLSQLAQARVCWHAEQVFIAVPTGSSTVNDRMLVYDTQHDWWTVYDIAASALTPFRRSDRNELHHGYSMGAQRIGHRDYGSTTDRGQPIVSRWRSGWSDYGSPSVKTLRESRLWGSGAIVVSFSTNFNIIQRAAIDVVLGAQGDWPIDGAGTWNDWLTLQGNRWPSTGEVGPELIRYATRGHVFSTQFSNSPQAPSWSVHRVVRHEREVRTTSVSAR